MSIGPKHQPATGTHFARSFRRRRSKYGQLLRPWLLLTSVRVLIDGLCGVGAITLAYGLRFDMQVPPWARVQMWSWALVLFILDPLVISVYGGYRSTWQYVGLRDLRLLAKRLTALHGVLLLVPLLSPDRHLMPYSIVIVDLVLVLFLSGGVRMLRRVDHEALLRLKNEGVSDDRRILIVGTAETIAGALRQLIPLYGKAILGAVMEGEWLVNRSILGVRIFGGTASLGNIIRTQKVSLLFLCSASMDDLPGLLQIASDCNVPVKLLPSVRDLLDDHVRVSRPVTVAALRRSRDRGPGGLGAEVMECLRDKTVLVTGAGGSIGSELVRQVVTAPIRKLILLDQDENALFELLTEFPGREGLHPVVGDIRDREALRRIFLREQPQVILHAAAYKHVPMMEANPCEAVLNNVCGTRNLAEAARAFGAERMVMISSDKAVRPSSVMGATKRLAEVVIQQIARSPLGSGSGETEFACVRFGNVLGSRGSVLPLFLKQIEQGGPLTVTHEQMTRYFMTIPQAVHLVLQAATLGSRGHIYMLDMGDPVNIMSLAREVIQLAGLTPGKDIEIRVVGSRPGEKLHEQLWREDAQVTPTDLAHIFQVFAEDPDLSFSPLLDKLEDAARRHRSDLIPSLLQQLPIDYLPARSALIA